jgi:hypothetical protein
LSLHEAVLKRQRDDAADASMKLRKTVRANAMSGCFSLDWVAAGHSAITPINGDAELAKHWKDNAVLQGPFVVKNSDELDALLVEKNADSSVLKETPIKAVLAAWHEKVKKDGQTNGKDRVAAPATTQHKAATLDPFFDKVVPKSACHDSAAIATVSGKRWFFGCMETMVVHDFEPDYMGATKLVMNGELQVLMFPGKVFLDVLADDTKALFKNPAELANKKPHEKAHHFVKTCLSDGNAAGMPKKLKDAGVTVFCGVVSAKEKPQILVTPPGYYVYTKVCNLQPVSGAWKTFMSKGEANKLNYTAACPDSVAIKQSVLDCFEL